MTHKERCVGGEFCGVVVVVVGNTSGKRMYVLNSRNDARPGCLSMSVFPPSSGIQPSIMWYAVGMTPGRALRREQADNLGKACYRRQIAGYALAPEKQAQLVIV